MTRMRFGHVVLSLLLLATASARADYLEVRRSTAIRAEPQAEAEVLARPAIGTHLLLFTATQTPDGYYRVRIPASFHARRATGYVHRSRVRGFPGDPPDSPEEPPDSDDEEQPAPAPSLPAPPEPPVAPPAPTTNDVVYGGVPVNGSTEYPVTILDKGHFVIGYSEDFKNPAWVFYSIGPIQELRAHPRPSSFATDGETTSQVKHGDYTNSGYSRGHMAPNFAMGSRFGAEGARSTFVMSNVTPQYQSFNDGQWGDLEEWIAGRKPPNATAETFIKGWADVYERVWVVAGPLFEDDLEPLEAGVAVPSSFFCIVVDEEQGQPRAMAFIMPHVDQRIANITQYLTTIDNIESRSGFDFFSTLPDDVESPLESGRSARLWDLPVHPH